MRNRFIRVLASAIVLGLVIPLASPPRAAPSLKAGINKPLSGPAQARAGLEANVYHLAWARTFGHFFSGLGEGYWDADECADAQPTGDRGVVIAGTTDYGIDATAVAFEVFVMEIRPSGKVDWKVLYEADQAKKSDNRAYALTGTHDGGYFVVGSAEAHTLVMKIGHDGTVQWIRACSVKVQGEGEFDSAGAVVETRDGGFVILGKTFPHGTWIIKLDSGGHALWHRGLGDIGGGSPRSIQATADGGFVLAVDGVYKFGPNGFLQWHASYEMIPTGAGDANRVRPDHDNSPYSYPTAISCTDDGGYILTGYTHAPGPDEFGWLCKLDRSGQIIWHKAYAWSVATYAFQTKDGGYLALVGYNSILKVSRGGALQWQRSISPGQDLHVVNAFQTEDEGYVLAYNESDSAGRFRFGVMQTDLRGTIGPSCSLLAASSVIEAASSMHMTPASSISFPETSVRMSSLPYVHFPRPCRVETICAAVLPRTASTHRGPVS